MNTSTSQSSRSVSPSPITQRKRIELIKRARRVSRCKFLFGYIAHTSFSNIDMNLSKNNSDRHFIVNLMYPLVLSEKSTMSSDKIELTTSQHTDKELKISIYFHSESFSRYQPVMKLMSQIMTAVKMKTYSQVAKIVCYILQIKYSLIKLLLKSQEEILKFSLAGRSQYRIRVRVSLLV